MPPSSPVRPAGQSLLDVALPRWRTAALAAFGLSGLLNLLLLSGSMFMLLVYDSVLPARSLASLVGLVILLAIACAFQAAIDRARQVLLSSAAQQLDAALSPAAFRQALASPGTPCAMRDLAALGRFLQSPAPFALLDLPWTVLFLAVLFACHWLLGLAVLAGIGVVAGLTVLSDRASRRAVEAASGHALARQEHAAGCIASAGVLRALGMEDALSAQAERLRRQGALAPDAEAAGTIRAVSRTVRLLLQGLVMALGAALVIAGEMTGGAIVAASILAGRALGPLDAVIAQGPAIAAARAAWQRLAGQLARESAEDVAASRERPPAGQAGPLRTLAVQALAVGPAGAAPLLSDIALTLSAGEIAGLTGLVGSGKSTLLATLAGAEPAAAGAFVINGHPDLGQPDAGLAMLARRGRIGYLPQSAALLAGTIGQNIARFAPGADPSAIERAARLAGVHERIARLPLAYETLVGPHADRALSGGEVRMIALARALFGDPDLVLLDEPDAGLDPAGLAALAAALAEARRRGALVLVASHRLDAFVRVDRLIAIRGGTPCAVAPALAPAVAAASQPAKPASAPPTVGRARPIRMRVRTLAPHPVGGGAA